MATRNWTPIAATLALVLGWAGGATAQSTSVSGAAAAWDASTTEADLDATIKAAFNVTAYSLHDVTVEHRGAGEMAFTVPLEGAPVSAVIRWHSIRHHDFQVLVDRGGGVLEQAPVGEVETVRGELLGEPGSRVAGMVRGGQLWALIRRADGSLWSVQPLSEAIPGSSAVRCVVFAAADNQAGDWGCGNSDPDHAANLVKPADPMPGDDLVTQNAVGDRVAEIACDADLEFYARNQFSVDNARADIENVMNAVETIYEGESIDVAYEVTTILVRTVAGAPYTPGENDSGVLLDIFKATWNTSHRNIRRDIAHLFTGRDLDGTTIGVAFLSQICSSIQNGNGYGLSQSRFSSNFTLRTGLTAHELGHNWSATHCDQNGCTGSCGIMCSAIAGCGAGASQFFPCSANQVIAFRNSRNCLTTEPASATLPFFESFPAATLSSANWTWINGADTFAAGGAPSAPLAMQLNGTATVSDEIRSTFIPLTGVNTARVSFKLRSNAPAGAQLFVEYWANNLRWQPLRTVVSSGPTTTFSALGDSVPTDGRWAEFRIRFRTDLTVTTSQFFVDDVRVGAALPCPADFNGDGELDQEDLSGFITAYFAESPGPGGYGQICPPPSPLLGYQADFNRDCFQDQEDLSTFITEWLSNEACP